MCFSSNVQCKLVSSSHAAKYRVITPPAGSDGYIQRNYNTSHWVNIVYNLKLRWRVIVERGWQ